MLGINADFNNPGFKTINLNPYPSTQNSGDLDLSHVQGKYDTKYGQISVNSNYSDNLWEYTFSTPSNTTTKLTMPKLGFSKFYINGKDAYDLDYDKDGIKLEREEGDNLVFKVKSGSFCTS